MFTISGEQMKCQAQKCVLCVKKQLIPPPPPPIIVCCLTAYSYCAPTVPLVWTQASRLYVRNKYVGVWVAVCVVMEIKLWSLDAKKPGELICITVEQMTESLSVI